MAAESKDMTDEIKETTSTEAEAVAETAADTSVAVAEKPAAKVSVGKLSASELIQRLRGRADRSAGQGSPRDLRG